MFILGKLLDGVKYYLMAHPGQTPFGVKGHKGAYWTKKPSKAFKFETAHEVHAIGLLIFNAVQEKAPENFHDDPKQMAHLYYGMRWKAWTYYKWLAEYNNGDDVHISFFYRDLGEKNHVGTTFAAARLQTAQYPQFQLSPARQKKKEVRATRRKMIKEAFDEARANGTLS